MKIRTVVSLLALVVVSRPALAITDVCIWNGYGLIHYVTMTSAEASDPEVEGYEITTDYYTEEGSWIIGVHRADAKNGGAGMQDKYHQMTWGASGDMVNGNSITFTDWNGEWYHPLSDYEIVSYGQTCWALQP